MEFGESPSQCLRRELMEELEVVPLTMTQFKLSETVVQNRFNPSQQVIGIYYRVTIDPTGLNQINTRLNLAHTQGSLTLVRREWLSGKDLLNSLSFPMDLEIASGLL